MKKLLLTIGLLCSATAFASSPPDLWYFWNPATQFLCFGYNVNVAYNGNSSTLSCSYVPTSMGSLVANRWTQM